MNKAKQIEELKRLWHERNPQHDNNADTGKDMFWETALCVFNDLNQILSVDSIRLSFDEIFHFNCWITKNNWYEACDGEYDNSETPNKCMRLTYEELYKLYLNEEKIKS